MKDFINGYDLDNQSIKEYVDYWLKNSFFNIYNRLMCFIIIILGLILLVISWIFNLQVTFMVIGGIDIFSSLLVLIVYKVKLRKIYDTMKTRIKILASDINYIQNEFHGDKCVVNSNLENKKNTIPLSLIKDRYESKNYYIIIFEGQIAVQVSKNGFQLGTFEEFKKYIKKYPKKKKIRPLILSFCFIILILMTIKYLYLIFKMPMI